MLGTFGFSYIGLIFLLCLFIPNIIWAANQPVDKITLRENRLLLILERLGQVAVTVLLLIFSDYNFHGWDTWLVVAIVATGLYLVSWLRYFGGGHVVADFYRPLFGIPYPLATLPIIAAANLAAYGRVGVLMLAVIILGVGHIGIHMQYGRELKNGR